MAEQRWKRAHFQIASMFELKAAINGVKHVHYFMIFVYIDRSNPVETGV